ncbi:hypothetical protein [Mesorhizobium sp. IMUNJ 23232]|uniref:hypothetical protein n=1 Tax=Mesorhizobium sp. IMUNJ 23232 TaxID=3376064 RepID=UPI003799F075
MEWTDWNAAVEKNREALKRVLATLVGMAGPGSDRRFFLFRWKRFGSPETGQAEKGKLSPALTLPRHLHRAMLMLLLPAEAAARRLIIAAARGLVVAMPPRTPEPISTELPQRSPGIAVIMSPADFVGAAEAKPAAAIRADRPRTISLPLLDPLRNPTSVHRHSVPAHAVQRIMPFGDGWPYRFLPPPPSPDDPIDAARLSLRLQALAAALDDLPAQARRFGRWKARNDLLIAQHGPDRLAVAQDRTHDTAAAQNTIRHTASVQGKKADTPVRFRRTRPLKPAHPPGWRLKPAHQAHEVLKIVHGFAFPAREPPDTS